MDDRFSPMDAPATAAWTYLPGLSSSWQPGTTRQPVQEQPAEAPRPFRAQDPEFLRAVGWEVGEQKPAEHYAPPHNHVGLAMISPSDGFAHWRIRHEWVEETARQRGGAWHHCRLVLRLYDVSYIQFNGFNAHAMFDVPLQGIVGQHMFKVGRPGTWQLAEVGFVLRNGEFLPAARSHVVQFPRDCPSPRTDHAALYVDRKRRLEPIGNIWDQERILEERRKPRLRQPLRIASLALESLATGHDGPLARFVSQLAAGKRSQGHEVHVFVPASPALPHPRQIDGVDYEPLPIDLRRDPLDLAAEFARAVEARLRELPPFDLVHHHEWLTAGVRPPARATVLSLTTIEAVRRNGTPLCQQSLRIELAEREVARAAGLLLTPDWLRERAVATLGVDAGRVHGFPMEARLPTEWEAPLDYGKVKMEYGIGPLDRMLLYVGPLEHAAGVDLLIEALPTVLRRAGNARLALVGTGSMHGHLQHRAHEQGVGHAVRLLGHQEGWAVTRLLRSAEALVLPSRHRVPFDDAVVGLARRAGRPVVTTHAGPAHLVRHEETGVITYDNPGSMVWALDRILGDPYHAERMGRQGKQADGGITVSWGEVAQRYLDICAACFPELRTE